MLFQVKIFLIVEIILHFKNVLCTAYSYTDQCRVSAGYCSSPAIQIYGPAGQVLHAATEDHQKRGRDNPGESCHDPGVS